MHASGVLELVLLLLATVVITVPIFRRLGLGAILGYLAGGIAIGPQVLALVPEPMAILAVSELGVVMLLFLIGLELSPPRLWVMRRQVFGLGALQVLGSAALLAAWLTALGWGWKTSLIVATALALSSTAVGLQLLAERKELGSEHGRVTFAILLFQDLAVLPALALIAVLGETVGHTGFDWESLARAVLAIAAVIVVGRWLLRHLFHAVANAHSVEVFTASALLVVAGTAWLMQEVGLSMGLGAFLAGVLLADSEFRHELESHIEPFKGLLLGLFFLAVGMSLDLGVVAERPLPILAGVAAVMAIKGIVLLGVGRLGGLGTADALRLAAVLAMGGEFAFVLLAEAHRASLLDAALRDRLVAIVGLSMACTPPLVSLLARMLGRPKARRETPAAADLEAEPAPVILAGFGRMGQIVGRLLRASGIPFTALENSPEQVELSRRFGTRIHFGDPARLDLLRAAHADRARLIVVTTDDPDANLRTVRIVRRVFPHLRIIARARNRQHAFRLMDLGVDAVIRETFHSAIEMGRLSLCLLGMDEDQARRRAIQFARHDEALLREQHLVYDDEAALVASSREALEQLIQLFEADPQPGPSPSTWDDPQTPASDQGAPGRLNDP